MHTRVPWYLVSAHGAVLVYIAVHAGTTVDEIARDMFLTRRTVWGIIGDLRRADMLHIHRDGRYHHYEVNLEAYLRHPQFSRFRLRHLLKRVVDDASHAVPA